MIRDRLTAVVGAGVITMAVSAALVAGAGAAVADTEPAAGTDTPSKVESAEPADQADTDTDSDEPASDEPDPDTDSDELDTDELDSDEPEAEQAEAHDGPDRDRSTDEPPVADEVTEEAPVEETVDTAPSTDADDSTDRAVAVPDAAEDVEVEALPALDASSTTTPVTAPAATARALDTAAEAATAPRRQTLLSLIGTFVFNIYSVAIRVFGGPPILPPNSTVTVRSSALRIDCGDSYEVPADWYVPEGVTPTRLIYFQHGFMAAGPFYSYTAARLAEATHSIVVAPTLTSNFLSCDGCWVGGSPMHKAVADLFVDGNTALAESALAAGYSATLLDGVAKVALIGHSAGGGLSAGAAGYMTQNGSFDRLAGVVMLDGVGFGDVTPQALEKLPMDFPIYNLAARAYYWNMSGVTNTAMETWRPGGFNGVKLTRSSHGDAMTGGNLFVQVAMNLVTGWPKPANVKAAEMISAGWLNDMFSGTQASGYYGAPDATLQIETGTGTATANVLPGPTERKTFIDWLFGLGATIIFGIDFATCAADPDEALAEMVAPNTALSLDGRAKPGQSIGQQCVHG